MKQTILLIAVFVLCTNTYTQTVSKLSLKQTVEIALANNIPVKQAGLQADANEVNLKQARLNMLPDLNGNFGYGFNQGRNVDPLTNGYINQKLTSSNIGLSSGIILFNGLRLQNLVKQNNLTYEASKLDLQQAKDDLTLNVILAYLQVLSNADVLEITNAQLEVTKKQVERLTILVTEGAVANYLLAEMKGQLADEEIALINAVTALQQSKLALCQLMNIDYNENIELEQEEVEVPMAMYINSPADVYQSSLQNFSLIKSNELKIKSAEKTIRVSRSAFYPSLSLTGNLGSNYSSLAETLTPTTVTEIQTGSYVVINGNQNPVLKQQQNYSSVKTGYSKQLNNNLGTFLGLYMQIPLFNGFQARNRVKLSQISLKNTQMESDKAKLQLRQNIEQAHMNMTTSYKRYAVLAEQIKNFEESFRAAAVRFENGVINSAEYLISKNNLDRTKIYLSQSKYEYIFRTKLLDYYQGKLLW